MVGVASLFCGLFGKKSEVQTEETPLMALSSDGAARSFEDELSFQIALLQEAENRKWMRARYYAALALVSACAASLCLYQIIVQNESCDNLVEKKDSLPFSLQSLIAQMLQLFADFSRRWVNQKIEGIPEYTCQDVNSFVPGDNTTAPTNFSQFEASFGRCENLSNYLLSKFEECMPIYSEFCGNETLLNNQLNSQLNGLSVIDDKIQAIENTEIILGIGFVVSAVLSLLSTCMLAYKFSRFCWRAENSSVNALLTLKERADLQAFLTRHNDKLNLTLSRDIMTGSVSQLCATLQACQSRTSRPCHRSSRSV